MNPKIVVVVLLIGMVVALFSGLFFLMRDTSSSRRTMRMLALRVGLSVAMIVFLFIAMGLGWIRPHGVGG